MAESNEGGLAVETVVVRESGPLLWIGVAVLVALAAVGGFLVGRNTAEDGDGSVAQPATSDGTGTPTTLTASEALLQQALTLHTNGQLAEAQVAYEQVLESDPANVFALYNLGLIAQTGDDNATAIERYLEAITLDDAFFPAVYNLGLAYAATGDNVNAEETLRRAVELDDQSPGALFNLGKVLVVQGQQAEGEQFIAQAIALDPSLANAA